MHAATITDGSVIWREHADPEPGHGELLVRVKAAGLNGADMMQRKGLYPAPPDASADIPGLELAGEVIAVGPATARFAVGDKVMAVVGGGAQAELAVVHERVALPVPAGLGWAEAGGFPEVFTTAHDALFSQCDLTVGERVLIHGAAGGVGIAAVQLAARGGGGVVGTVRNDALRPAVAEIGGACGVVDVCAPDGYSERGPYDVILELVGAPNLPGDLAALATGGRIAVIGVGAGATAEVNLLQLMSTRGRIHGSTLRARPLEEKGVAARAVERSVLPLLANRELHVPIAAEFPMADVESAYERFAAGAKLGKVVLVA